MRGHGVTVQPLEVTLPLGDTVVKGTCQTSAQKPCEVLPPCSPRTSAPDGRVEDVFFPLAQPLSGTPVRDEVVSSRRPRRR